MDIEPTREWQNEIESALRTADTLVALLDDGFHASNWTDQEIGMAMGRGIPVFSVRCGQDPYGFIGRFQALNGFNTKGERRIAGGLARAIFVSLLKHKQTKRQVADILVELFEKSRSWDSAKAFMTLLESLDFWEEAWTPSILEAIRTNVDCREAWGVPTAAKALLRKWKQPTEEDGGKESEE